LYSGTVGAALEAALHGIPSIACSLDFGQTYPLPHPKDMNWKAAEEMLARIVGETVRNTLSTGFVLNVNLPHLPIEKIKGDMAVREREKERRRGRERETERGRERERERGGMLTCASQVFACAIRGRVAIRRRWWKWRETGRWVATDVHSR
jgi:5'/3'-nucleotidase SurE